MCLFFFHLFIIPAPSPPTCLAMWTNTGYMDQQNSLSSAWNIFFVIQLLDIFVAKLKRKHSTTNAIGWLVSQIDRREMERCKRSCWCVDPKRYFRQNDNGFIMNMNKRLSKCWLGKGEEEVGLQLTTHMAMNGVFVQSFQIMPEVYFITVFNIKFYTICYCIMKCFCNNRNNYPGPYIRLPYQ